MTWPFMADAALHETVQGPRAICAACETAEAPRPLLTPLCDRCNDRLAGFGLPVSESRPSA